MDDGITDAGGRDAPRTAQVAPAVLRAGKILDALAAGPPSATLASLSRRLGFPRSSTLALCNSLVEIGLLVRDPDGSYRLGPHTLDLSRSFLQQTDLPTEFQRAVAELGLLAEQTLVCGVLRGRDVVYIGRRTGTSALAISYEIGMRLPAHCTASGLAMLSCLSDSQLDELYADGDLERLTERSIGTTAELHERLATVRERGHAIDDEETAAGMVCVGVPVRDGGGPAAGAVAVSMPKGAQPQHRLADIAGQLQRISDAIARGLGAP